MIGMDKIRGSVWKFGDNTDTDAIVPGRYLAAEMEEVIKHVFEAVRPEFAQEVKKGDIIVAGRNFGCGSSRENAPAALKELGIGCIVAESFGRIFFRNAIAVGLPVISCAGVSANFADQDPAEIRLAEAQIRNLSQGSTLAADSLSADMVAVIDKGGIIELLKEREEEKEEQTEQATEEQTGEQKKCKKN